MIETATAPPPSWPQSGSSSLVAGLSAVERWREFSVLGAAFMFETDDLGRLTFVTPDFVMGRSTAAWLGRPAAGLLMDHGAAGPDPFRTASPVTAQHVWLTGTDGTRSCFAISAAPMIGRLGQTVGTRGIGVDVTETVRLTQRKDAAILRGAALERVLGQLREEVLAPRMMDAVLTEAMRAMNAAGAAVVSAPPGTVVTHAVGSPVAAILNDASALLEEDIGADIRTGIAATGMQILACPASTRFGEQSFLVVWRPFRAGEWDADDRLVASAMTGVLRIVLEHEAIQRQLAMQSRTDAATGLLNRRAFIEEAGRRIDRLDREALPGTLLSIEIDQYQSLLRRLGHEGADQILMRTADLLRGTFRPTDLLARLGGASFLVWLDGSDSLTAAERADHLRLSVPAAMADIANEEPVGLSIGVACRAADSLLDLDTVLHQAGLALEEAKQAHRAQGTGQWRVFQPTRA